VLLNSWISATIASIGFTAFAYLVLDGLLEFAIKVPEVREAAHEYLKYRLLGIASMVVTFSFKAFFDGVGKTHVHVWSALGMNLFHVLFCWAFIFGTWRPPRVGVGGAGVAALLSTWIGLVIMLGWAMRGKYRRTYHPCALRKFDPKLVKDILRV